MNEIRKHYDPTSQRRSKIELVGTRTWVASVEKLLNQWIYPSHVGRAVLNEIYAAPAHASLEIRGTSTPSYATPSGNTADAHHPKSNVGAFYKATGKGTSSQLFLDVTGKLPSKMCPGKCANPRFNLPRYILLHEMIHSMRHVNGKWRNGKTMMNGKAVDSEEALAILITNMFMSEKGDNLLRVDHGSLDARELDPKAHAAETDVRPLLARIKADHPRLFSTVAGLKQTRFPFNPFAFHT